MLNECNSVDVQMSNRLLMNWLVKDWMGWRIRATPMWEEMDNVSRY